MKKSTDPRHLKRIKIVQSLFAQSFTDQDNLPKFAKDILSSSDKIDGLIREAAPTWPIDKLNKIDLAILRLAVYELTNSQTPPKVVIDEAVELAKAYGSDNSASFVNGVLGTILKDKINDKKKLLKTKLSKFLPIN